MPMEFTDLLLWLLAVAMIVGGFIGCIYPLVPGLPLMMGGMWLWAWVEGYAKVGSTALITLGVLTALGMLLDFVAGLLGARKVKASKEAVTGAFLGSLVGIFFGLPGMILGPFVGAILGEIKARSSMGRALDVGVATWMGLLFGALMKLAIGIAMLGTFAFAWFF